ncbi:MAG: hypothetical protein NZ898_09360 [Myxococcota bacterium]|nr:hypothetical protein [Myxococcota bacterium]MDW8362806.1 hypothetical protein [Myxococcales bacterium]
MDTRLVVRKSDPVRMPRGLDVARTRHRHVRATVAGTKGGAPLRGAILAFDFAVPSRARPMLLVVVTASLAGCFRSSEVPMGTEVVAVEPATGERRTFASAGDVPPGWERCSDDGCPAPLACHRLEEGACLARADCMVVRRDGMFLGCARAGAPSCPPERCAEAEAVALVACDDGSVGGGTGRCVMLADGRCEWEAIACPDRCDCGDAPPVDPMCAAAMPRCEARADGRCAWLVTCETDPVECAAEQCGTAPVAAAWVCGDGSVGGFTGRCVRDASGRCVWEFAECPSDECDPSACGPRPSAPTRPCPEGMDDDYRCVRTTMDRCEWVPWCGLDPRSP